MSKINITILILCFLLHCCGRKSALKPPENYKRPNFDKVFDR